MSGNSNNQDLSLVTTVEFIQQLVLDILFKIYESIDKNNSQGMLHVGVHYWGASWLNGNCSMFE